jgi:transcriptional regulator with GAF, ATPase, and Fis domain
MKTTLIAISGPLQGAEYALEGEELSIGRELSNTITIPDMVVSRRHSLLRKQREGRYLIEDLDSANGLLVNDTFTREHLLEEGDRVRIGKSIFLFTHRSSAEILFEERQMFPRTAVQFSVEETLFARPERAFAAVVQTNRAARDLKSLLELSAAISSDGLGPLASRILEVLFEIVPADYGAIVLTGDEPGEFREAFGCSRLSGTSRPVAISRTAIQQAIRERAAILCNNIEENEELRKARSIETSGIQSILVVPMAVSGNVVGALYLASLSPQVSPFEQRDLELLTAVAALVAAPLENARRMAWLESENRRLVFESDLDSDLVGESPRMREVYQCIRKAAPSDSTVLILGESGTGKELAARAMHRNSPRAERPFIAVNCAALTETLLEAELFGHEKGAFTGAIALKRGKVEEAHGGTLFLDEIGEMGLSLQPKLLRVLQQREFERVGGNRPIRVNFRLVAATNRNLEEAVLARLFRQDLFYRLNVVTLRMPPLRERREDIPMLASYFVKKYAGKCKRRVGGLTQSARSLLEAYDWPGNVRELENSIERAVVMGSGELILPEDLPESLLETRAQTHSKVTIGKYHEAIDEVKKRLILSAFEQTRGSYTEAAKILGLQVNYLHRLTRNMNLRQVLKSAR